jgi:aspartate aminotransferase
MKLNSTLASVTESATMKLNAEAKRLAQSGVRVYNLTAGELDIPTLPSVRAGIKSRLVENKYTPTNGIPELRTALARDVRKRYKVSVGAEHVAVTAGAKQALFHALSIICNPGDEVIIPTPAWVSYEHMVRIVGAQPVFVPLSDTYDLDMDAVRKVVTPKTKAIIVNSPHNPTGALFSPDALRACAELAEERDLFIIADDIYNTLLYMRGYVPVTRFLSNFEHLIIVNGFSKSHAMTGWRVGYLVAHPDIIEANNRLQGHTSGNAAMLSQYGALAGLTGKSHANITTKLLKHKKLAELLVRKIPHTTFVSPKGAFYIFLDVRKYTHDTNTFCEALLRDEHVSVVSGEAFHAPGFLRISFSGNEKDLRRGIVGLARFISRLTPTP